MSLKCLVLTLLLAPIGAVQANESKKLAEKGYAAWTAFSCAALASHLKRQDEHEQLVDYGYKQGLEFIAAMRTGKITREDLADGVPLGVRFALQGPTPDFMLGRMYERATNAMLDRVYKSGEYFRTEGEQSIAALAEFSNWNCELLGDER